jgi:hypothetical protein
MTKKSPRRSKKSVSKKRTSRISKKSVSRRRSSFSIYDLPPIGDIPFRRQRAVTGLDFSPTSSPGRSPRITRRSIGDVNYFNAPSRSRSNSPDLRRLPANTRALLGLRRLPIVERDYVNVTPQRRMSRRCRRSRSCRR